MSFDFGKKVICIGGESEVLPVFQFYKRGFTIGNGSTPSYSDVVLSGVGALTLSNSLANGLNYLKLFGGTEQRNIPTEYTQVEYLDNNSTAWLDLGMPIGSADIVTFDMKWNAKLSAPFFGAYEQFGSYDSRSFVGTYYSNENSITFYANDINPIGSVTKPTGRCLLKWNGVSATPTLDGNEIGTKYPPYDNFTPNVNAYLFTRNQGGVAGNIDDITLYGFKVERNGVLIMDLVPAKRNSDNVLGMYNAVTGTFLTNSGTGDFTAGADVVPTPDYPMDIVCNNGVVKVSPNLVDFNETRINSSTWDSADKTKGFEVYADVYSKSIGSSMLTNANAFGVFVPCKQGESISLNFFDYEPFSTRCLYCEITADRKCNTTPQAYENAGVITQKTFTLTQSDSIGFVFEWWINSLQTRNYTASNYMIVKGSTPPTKYIPYGQIYTDGTVETVEVCTSTDITSKLITDYFITDSGNIGGNTFSAYSDLIPVEVGIKYKFVCSSVLAQYLRVHGYNANGTWVQMLAKATKLGEQSISAVIPNGIKYIRYSGYDTNVTLDTYLGGTATAEMLLKIGDYKDVQSVIDGSITRNVGIKVFDGSEDWYLAGSTANLFNTPILDSNTSNEYIPYSTHFQGVVGSTPYANMTDGTFKHSSNGNSWYFKKVDCSTVDQFKQFLADQYNAGLPVIVVYPLATPTTETVTGQPLTIQAGTNIVSITQASIDNLGLEVSYKATA